MGLVKCPFCAEDIQEGAKKCRYCGEFLDGELRHSEANSGTTETTSLGISNLSQAPAQQEIVFCMKCGRPMETTASTCSRCGTKVGLTPTQLHETGLRNPAAESKAQEEQDKRTGFFVLAAICVVVILLANIKR
jgi:uncharacterized membrane protein YvbJ